MLDKAREKARQILAKHQAKELDPNLLNELDKYVTLAAARTEDDFYADERTRHHYIDTRAKGSRSLPDHG